jgi:hypothetical protein
MKLIKSIFIGGGVFLFFLISGLSYADSPVGNCSLYEYRVEKDSAWKIVLGSS